jgi:(1->4)-alpha-D-glucan 1-alpha-D-glucosylmutase
MLIPSSTYRIQLNDAFTLTDLAAIVGYLHELGIATVYASPITTAVKGSRHGYDVSDALTLNPEIGTERQLKDLAGALEGYNMSWLQDIVPNHMAYDVSNPWLFDVLERGKDSIYFGYFDIMADATGDAGAPQDDRLMAPFLGSDLSACLDKGEITLQFTDRGFFIRYYDKDYPVAAGQYQWIQGAKEAMQGTTLSGDPASWASTKSEWLRQMTTDNAAREAIAARVAMINSQRPLLEQLLQNQHYRLTNAREASLRINYRRFFTINGLICLRMEKQEVFDAWHRNLYQWFENGWIDGLRVDHIDGLADPREYLRRLRRLFGQRCYVVAEKILTGKENLPANWPLEGTTGYDFLADASQVLTPADGAHQLRDWYKEQIIDLDGYKTVVYERKLNFLYKYMGGELKQLLRLLDGLPAPQTAKSANPADQRRLREALAVWMASFPVYRAYPDNQGVSPADRSILVGSMEAANDRRPDLGVELDFLAGLCDYDDSEEGRRKLGFLTRLMQWTGPLAAKGIEDTTFYVYNPSIAHCEVGDSPGIAGMPVKEFHRRMKERQSRWRHTLNATTTHDTKRGEDSRIRLIFLSAIPREWTDAVSQWRQLNAALIQLVAGRPSPSPNDEYLIYQSLLGGFPEDGQVNDDFRERVSGWLIKALREANTETNYDAPDEGYERQCQDFAAALLRPGSVFLSVFTPFACDVIRRSTVFSLSQLALKLTAPGIPDIYQGSELWELSFVDPDNRRPVDFGFRADLLRQIKTAEGQGPGALSELLRRRRDEGIEKLFLLYRVLHCRRQQPQLFSDGEYIPVSCDGPLLAYLRRYRDDWALVAVPLPAPVAVRLPSAPPDPRLPGPAPISRALTLPVEAPSTWTDVFTGAIVRSKSGAACRPEGLSAWPIIVLTGSSGRE